MPKSAVFLSAAMQPCRMFPLFALLACFAGPATAAPQPHPNDGYGQLPLHFEQNQGQAHKDVRFLARGSGYSLYLTAGEAVLVLATPNPNPGRNWRGTQTPAQTQLPTLPLAIGMRLVDAASAPQVSGRGELAGKANYFIGKDPSKWRTNLPTYAKVHYREVYPGIDLVYYGKQRQLEHDFVVSAGADAQRIVLSFDGAGKLGINAQGDLVLRQAGGDLHLRKPFIYQEINGTRREIGGGYVLKGANRVGFQVAAYDRGQPLIIDPVLSYSSYLGGSADDQGQGIAMDVAGNAYVTGFTTSANFPTTTGSFQPGFNAGSGSVPSDAFVTKLDATGSALVYSTYLGSNGDDAGNGIAVDAAGNAYVTGYTNSINFPTTSGAFQTNCSSAGDVFVSMLNPAGSALVYSTCLGGGSLGAGIAVDTAGNAYVTGHTSSPSFPTTAGSVQTICDSAVDVFTAKINPAGSALVYSTCFGGSGADFGQGIALDAGGNAYVTGYTYSTNFATTPGAFQTSVAGSATFGFVTKLNADGSAFIYSTYLSGGSDSSSGIAVDAAGSAYLTGWTSSSVFPTTAGAFQTAFAGAGRFVGDAFVTKLDPAGSALIYSTFLGGTSDDRGEGIAVDAAGNAHVIGSTVSSNFPTTPGGFQLVFGGGNSDIFVTKLDAAGAGLAYSTYFGGLDSEVRGRIALGQSGNAYVVGHTYSMNFPTTVDAFQTTSGGLSDTFIAKIDDVTTDNTPPGTAANSIPAANAAGWNNGPVTVMLNASDNDGGSGVASIAYSINGGAAITVSGATASFTLSSENVNTVAYHATDKAGNAEASRTLSVLIDATAPTGTVTLSPKILRPPDHRLVTITASISATDNLSGPVIVSSPVVTSNEPQSGLGKGDLQPDWVVSGTTLQLRAERARDGAGRIYTVTYTFTDQAGNSSLESATVTVPINR